MRNKRLIKWLVPILAIALMLSILPLGSVAAQPGATGPTVSSSVDAAMAKIHPFLLNKLGLKNGALSGMAASDEVRIGVFVKAGTDISQYMTWSLTRPFIDPMGNQLVVGAAKAGAILKIASLDNVVRVVPEENTVQPPDPIRIDPDIAAANNASAQDALHATGIEGWWDVGAGHNSREAWDMGYTGNGVNVMVNDSGIDFAHPDLQGTWATITDADSPYFGWPEMFDSRSTYLYILDTVFGTNYIASGMGHYSDTSATCTLGDCVYQPLNATEPHTYTLPATSISGTYHIGFHPDKTLADAVMGDWNGQYEGEEYVSVLVVDEHTDGVYDTVYVDMNGNFDFTDDKPVTKDDPITYLDVWDSAANAPGQDGYPDISGGLLYFIADGVNVLPASDWMWGKYSVPPDNGSLLAWEFNDFTEGGGDHGQLCASNVAGQGIIDGGAPPYKPAGDGSPFTGLVQGAGRDAKLSANGNVYNTFTSLWNDSFYYAALGYDGQPGTDDDMQIISNSWGFSSVDNDVWDFDSRLIDKIVRHLNPTLSVLISTGNGAPAYGTITGPSPVSSIGVGASTEFGSTGIFETIMGVDQINWGDVIPFSNRGPAANAGNGVSVTADGAFGSGALSLNEWGDGWTAWEAWGGTSRSAPVAAGNMSLIYDAYKQANGVWPTWDVARAILMSGANNQRYDTFVQGAGSVNGGQSAGIAGGNKGFFVMPDNWTGGDYRGVEYHSFANIMHPGDVSTKTFTVHNPTDADTEVQIRSKRLVKIGQYSFPFTSKDQSLEDGAFTKPDYLFPLTDLIPAGADMIEVKISFPASEFDVNGDYRYDNRWRVHIQDWKDLNGNGRLWDDLNGDGVVNADEIDTGEYIRFAYGYNSGPTTQVRMKMPLERMHDGLYLSLRHKTKSDAVPVTHLNIEITFYDTQTFDWVTVDPMTLTVPAGGDATFNATMTVPDDVPFGLFNGAIMVDGPDMRAVVPVVANVAASSANFEFGGGRRSNTPYDNGRMFGYNDWGWRAESGDWRFYFTDIMDDVSDNSLLFVDTQWDNPKVDIDTLVMGPTADQFSNDPDKGEPDVYGPYTLSTLPGSSANTYMGSGKWFWYTNTGGPREIVAVPASEGLHIVALHEVYSSGEHSDVSVSGKVGMLTVDPSKLDVDAPTDTVEATINVSASVNLDDLVAEGFGLGLPEDFTDLPIKQDDPNDPSTASFTQTVTIDHAASLTVDIVGQGSDDLDLFLLNPNGQVVASSTTSTATEHVSVKFPMDGDWTIWVHGWNVPEGESTFDMTINAVQGYDITVKNIPDGPFAAGDMIPITLEISHDMNLGDVLYGSVLLGPSLAPGLVEVPVVVTAVAPAPVTVELPLLADTWVDGGNTGANHYWDKLLAVRPTGLDNILFEFDRSALPVGADVVSAKLTLNAINETGAHGKNLSVMNVDPFDPTTVTFDDGLNYYNPGPALPVAMGLLDLDATDQVKAWDAAGSPGNAQLAVSADGPLGHVSFNSSEAAAVNPSGAIAPKLMVTYIPQRD